MNKKYTLEQINYIKVNIKGRSYQELTGMFNKRFEMQLKVSTMTSLASRHGLRNERDTRVTKGHVPHNKGKKKWYQGGEETQFEPGHRPWNYKPVGTERVNIDGYVEVKIADPKTWKGKHLIIWEEVNGTVPAGHVIIFADGNTQNVTLDNLLLISRKELLVMNKRRLITDDSELTKTGVIIADIYLKIGERKKKLKKRKETLK